MNQAQMNFLRQIADRIPRLFAALQEGNERAEYVLGNRIVAGRQVRLVLLAEVIDPGHNPLATHSTGAQSPVNSEKIADSHVELTLSKDQDQ